MLNVCERCGAWNGAPEVVGNERVCGECGARRAFRKLPLFSVTGASGAGKTTAALAMLGAYDGAAVLDQDILWSDEMNTADGALRFRNLWLRMAKNLNQSGRPVLLFGTAGPNQFERCPERVFLGELHYLALICDDEALAARLKARPAWRGYDAARIAEALQFNRWLRENGPTGFPGLSFVDTTHLSVAQTVEAIKSWLQAHWPPV